MKTTIPAAGRGRVSPWPLLLVGLAFLLSGGAALVYQVAWQRILELSSGIGIYSVAMIVAAFMAGLGIGNHLGSGLSVRMRPERALWAFACLELGVAVFGAISCTLFYDWLYVRAAWLYSVPWRAGLMHFASLLLPTVLMGMSLPFLAKAMVQDVARAPRTIGLLYGVNVLGASAGALLTPWVLIRYAGIRGAVLAAAAANASACVAALTAGFVARRRPVVEHRAADATPDSADTAPPATDEAPAGRPLVLWLGLYALSGFCALALEILWFRYLDVAVRSTAFAFGTLLSLYLLGGALGSLLGSLLVGRIRRPLRVFLIAQSALLAWSGLAVVALSRLPGDTPVISYYREAWIAARFVRLGRDTDLGRLAALYLGLPAILFAVPTILMGLSFPVLQRAVQDEVATSGRKVGILQAANIAGCIAGSLLVGLLLLSWTGTAGTLAVVVAVGIVFPLVGWWHYGARSAFPVLAALLLVVLGALPSRDALWARLHGSTPGAALIAEDATGLAVLTPRDDGWRVWINGRSFSILPFGGMHTILGAIPAVVHPAPRKVAIVGLGSGDTAWAVGCRGGATERITVFEICGPNLALLERVRGQGQAPPGLVRFLSDPRVSHAVADGRISLENARERYDVVEIDALWPANAYSGNLYSVEFFSLCARRLAAGGVMCSWCPTGRVRASFTKAFPHVVQVLGGQVMIGGNEPIAVDPAAWEARLANSQAGGYLGAELSRAVIEALRSAEPAAVSTAPETWLNRDLYPRDEFRVP